MSFYWITRVCKDLITVLRVDDVLQIDLQPVFFRTCESRSHLNLLNLIIPVNSL